MGNSSIIRFMGDVMIGRLVNTRISEMGYQYPWGNVLPTLLNSGLNIINLETTFTFSQTKLNKVFNFKADPDKVKTLTEGNIKIANLANNHILDYSNEGMMDTLKSLDNSGISHTGAGMSLADAKKPVIIDYEGTRIGMVGCTDNEPSWRANNHPGTYYIKVDNLDELEKDVISLREKVDLLILSIHWGPNMIEEPPDTEIKLAHRLIDLGVDIIHGHSAHIFQGIEIYNGKIIFYDTGDFIDDYMVDSNLRNDRSFLFECKITDKKVTEIKLIPVLIHDMQVNHAEGHDKEWCIARMQELSTKFGTLINSKGYVLLPIEQ